MIAIEDRFLSSNNDPYCDVSEAQPHLTLAPMHEEQGPSPEWNIRGIAGVVEGDGKQGDLVVD